MFSPSFLNLLVHPAHKTPLIWDDEKKQLCDTGSGDCFRIKENVPLLLTSSPEEQLAFTDRHVKEGTRFHYREHYQNDAAMYDYEEEAENPAEREEIRRLHERILAQIPATAEWILDVGCGSGWLAKELVPQKRKVISMDITDINPIKIQRRMSSEYHNAVVADVFELPFKADSIDCIVASEIIEHVPDPAKFMKALFSVLKPGGRFIITTPYNEFIRTSLCIHCNRLTPHNAHLHSFTENTIRKLLPQAAGNVSTQIFNSKLLVKIHLQKLLSFLPLAWYKVIDYAAVRITGKKAYRLMTLLHK